MIYFVIYKKFVILLAFETLSNFFCYFIIYFVVFIFFVILWVFVIFGEFRWSFYKVKIYKKMSLKWPRSLETLKNVTRLKLPKLSIVVDRKLALRHYYIQNVKDVIKF